MSGGAESSGGKHRHWVHEPPSDEESVRKRRCGDEPAAELVKLRDAPIPRGMLEMSGGAESSGGKHRHWVDEPPSDEESVRKRRCGDEPAAELVKLRDAPIPRDTEMSGGAKSSGKGRWVDDVPFLMRMEIVKDLDAWIGCEEEVQWLSEWLEKDPGFARRCPGRAAKLEDLKSKLPGMFESLKTHLEVWESHSGLTLHSDGVPVQLNDPVMRKLLRNKRHRSELVARRNEAVAAVDALKQESVNLGLLLQIGEEDKLKLKELASSFKLDSVTGPEVDMDVAAPEEQQLNAPLKKIELLTAELTELSTMEHFHQAINMLPVNLGDVIAKADKCLEYGTSEIVALPSSLRFEFTFSDDLYFVYGAVEQAATSFQELVNGELDETLKRRAFQQASSAADKLLQLVRRLVSSEIVECYMQLLHRLLTAVANACWKLSRMLSMVHFCEWSQTPPFPMGLTRLQFVTSLESFCKNCSFGASIWNERDKWKSPGAAGALAAVQTEVAKLQSQIYEACGKKFRRKEMLYLDNDEKEELDSSMAIGIWELELHLEGVVTRAENLLQGNGV